MSKTPEQLLEIHDLSHDGRGVGRLAKDNNTASGKACFIAGALPGEQVRWKLTNSKRSYNEGVCTEIIKASDDRVEPRCNYYQDCGGCELQHMDASAQLLWKERQLRQTFSKAGLEAQNWMPPLSTGAWNYRRRTRLAIHYGKGRVLMGLRARGSHQVVEISRCEVLDSRLNNLLGRLDSLVNSIGSKSILDIELSAADSELAVCFNLKQPFGIEDEQLLADALAPAQVWQKLPQRPAQPLADYSSLRSQVAKGLLIDFTPSQFVQVNADLNVAMVQQALDWVQPQPDQKLLDLFCGGGNFSLAFARQCQSVLGVEGSAVLCEQGRQNAKLNGIENIEFKTLDLNNSSQFGRLGKQTFDLVLLDPPREGAMELMPWLNRSKAEKILYVSCHPATMARDLAQLSSCYRVARAGAMDMFPQTTHIEAMALLLPA